MDFPAGRVELDLSSTVAPVSDADLADCREQMASLPSPPLSDAVERTDHRVGHAGTVVRVHRPVDAEAPLPALLWLHGGGLVMGDRLQDDARFDRWCARHRFLAVTVEYRLAPEAPYPAALEDGHTALVWLHEHAEELGVDRRRIGIGGDSAGGGLAAAVSLVARRRRELAPAFLLLVYPMLDDRRCTASSGRDVPVWPPAANAYAWRSYLGDRCGAPDLEPSAAPARAADLSGLPPTYLTVGTEDGFLDEDIDFARRLAAAGVPVDLRVHAGLPHGYDVVAPRAPATRQALRDLHEWLAQHLEPAVSPATRERRP